ncbi:hypothetical protein BpHYR1_022691 [Brachionus plicatilis]|uniref:Uncharacterized protein n=1 Tax=Brachionus plicatilis TaxID=10195 RepID=A0A3M7R7Y8_BRAPC|nr:hypothetical protein BpHYR1_022691 [Brachionus plicatilis]
MHSKVNTTETFLAFLREKLRAELLQTNNKIQLIFFVFKKWLMNGTPCLPPSSTPPRVSSHYVQRATIGDLSCRTPPQASLAVAFL